MTKPTSWCIDIRQEHPLLDKFKEWFKKEYMFVGSRYVYRGCDEEGYNARQGSAYLIHDIITLDQRWKWRGRKYYVTDNKRPVNVHSQGNKEYSKKKSIENAKKIVKSVRDGKSDFINDFKNKLDELNKDMTGSYYGYDSLNLIQVMNILSNYKIFKK